MQLPDPTSSHWTDKIIWMLGGGGVLTALAGLVKLIFYRNKPKSEIAKIDADTEQTHAGTAVTLSNQLVTLHDKINLLEASVDARQRENAETIQFYRKQIIRFEELDLAYRQRFHAVNSELGRLGLEIRELEGCYSDLLSTGTGETREPVNIKTYEQIVEKFPLPPSDE